MKYIKVERILIHNKKSIKYTYSGWGGFTVTLFFNMFMILALIGLVRALFVVSRKIAISPGLISLDGSIFKDGMLIVKLFSESYLSIA